MGLRSGKAFKTRQFQSEYGHAQLKIRDGFGDLGCGVQKVQDIMLVEV